jgi:hypothetical protein
MRSQFWEHNFPNQWVAVYREHNVQIWKALQQCADGLADSAHGLAQVLSPVQCNEHHAARRSHHGFKPRVLEPAGHAGHFQQGVYDRVAGKKDPGRGNAFSQKPLPGKLSGGEVQVGHYGYQPAIDLLGKWLKAIIRAEACLYVPEWHFVVKCSEAGHESGCGVALRQRYGGLNILKYGLQPCQSADGDLSQALALLHDVQIVVRVDVKCLEHLVQLGAVLCGHGDHGFNLV